jgi:putative heme-binding domain-containing protein
VGAIVKDVSEPEALRERVAGALAEVRSEAASAALVEGMRGATRRLQNVIATAMAKTPTGAAALLTAVADDRAPRALLQDQGIQDKIVANQVPGAAERIKALTKGLEPASAELERLIEQRRSAFAQKGGSAERGRNVFVANCAACHAFRGFGGVVGPQLDGVGNRGVGRVVEDILDPSRNVDPAFRYVNVSLKDGRVISGIFRRNEGDAAVYADSTGKEVTVPKGQVVRTVQSSLSLMPGNFGTLL